MNSKKRDKYTGIVLMIIGILIIWFAIFGCSAKPQRNTWYYTNGIVSRDSFYIDYIGDGGGITSFTDSDHLFLSGSVMSSGSTNDDTVQHFGEWRRSSDKTNPIVAFRNSYFSHAEFIITRTGRLGVDVESYDWIGDECGGYYIRTCHPWGLKIIIDSSGRRGFMIRDSIDPKDTFKFNY